MNGIRRTSSLLPSIFHRYTSTISFTVFTSVLLSASISSSFSAVQCDDSLSDNESIRYSKTLQQYKLHLEEYRQKWNWKNVGSRIPTVSWPTNLSTKQEFSTLIIDSSFCDRNQRINTKINNSTYCQDIQFKIATHLLVQADTIDSQIKGLDLLQKLVQERHPDAICFYAILLNDGKPDLNIESNPAHSVSWWKIAVDQYSHVQSMYELGVAYYTGEGVEEDDTMAVYWFRRAVNEGEHAGAAFMLGDCLLDGVGVERDRSEALMWLVVAAELGHRGARSRVLATLEFDENRNYGGFTDSSRQTLVEDVNDKNIESGINQETTKIERRFTVSEDVTRKPSLQRSPVVLARRRTIVQESRNHD